MDSNIPPELEDALAKAAPAPEESRTEPEKKESKKKRGARGGEKPAKKQRKESEESGISLGADEREYKEKKKTKGKPDTSTEEDEDYVEMAESVYSEASGYSAAADREKELAYMVALLHKVKYVIESYLDREARLSIDGRLG